jgi:hypothetical protein
MRATANDRPMVESNQSTEKKGSHMVKGTLTVKGTLRYRDTFAAGWHLHACKYNRKYVVETQAANNAFLKLEEVQGETTGMVDGWDARESEAKKANP